jgi:hypothetical protein
MRTKSVRQYGSSNVRQVKGTKHSAAGRMQEEEAAGNRQLAAGSEMSLLSLPSPLSPESVDSRA